MSPFERSLTQFRIFFVYICVFLIDGQGFKPNCSRCHFSWVFFPFIRRNSCWILNWTFFPNWLCLFTARFPDIQYGWAHLERDTSGKLAMSICVFEPRPLHWSPPPALSFSSMNIIVNWRYYMERRKWKVRRINVYPILETPLFSAHFVLLSPFVRCNVSFQCITYISIFLSYPMSSSYNMSRCWCFPYENVMICRTGNAYCVTVGEAINMQHNAGKTGWEANDFRAVKTEKRFYDLMFQYKRLIFYALFNAFNRRRDPLYWNKCNAAALSIICQMIFHRIAWALKTESTPSQKTQWASFWIVDLKTSCFLFSIEIASYCFWFNPLFSADKVYYGTCIFIIFRVKSYTLHPISDS